MFKLQTLDYLSLKISTHCQLSFNNHNAKRS